MKITPVFAVVALGLSALPAFADEYAGRNYSGKWVDATSGEPEGTAKASFKKNGKLEWCFKPVGGREQCSGGIGYKIENGTIVFGGQRTRFEFRKNGENRLSGKRWLDGQHTENGQMARID